MDMKDLIIELSDAKAKASTAEKDVERLERELAAERGRANEAEANARQLETDLANARAEAQNAAEPTQEERQRVETLEKETKASVDFLTEQFTAVMAAAGKTDAKAPEGAEELIAAIKEVQPELSAIIPVNGVSLAANTNGEPETKQDFAQFRPANRAKR